jgi:hypothetical protein
MTLVRESTPTLSMLIFNLSSPPSKPSILFQTLTQLMADSRGKRPTPASSDEVEQPVHR